MHGIQEFIFKTNELKDIVGASELVNQICKEAFEEFTEPDEKSIIRSAGNIKHVFDSEERCRKAVREFPKKIMEMAPGITISQAVVRGDGKPYNEIVNELESRLKAQRNSQVVSYPGILAMQRVRSTGLPSVGVVNSEHVDLATKAKKRTASSENINSTKNLCKVCFGVEIQHEKIAYDIEKITKHNAWIALIQVDGNDIGRIVQKIGNNEEQSREFSQLLSEATIGAARQAFDKISKLYDFDNDPVIPIRPIILGGDDFAAICRADVAVDYVKEFLIGFRDHTTRLLGQILMDLNVYQDGSNCLSAAAGIAFIKSSFPFYYGYALAKDLCDTAKLESKKGLGEMVLTKPCLMFHKVQDSFVESYKFISERELERSTNISFKYGPYYVDGSNQNSIDTLTKYCEMLTTGEGNAVKSNLRQWISILHDNTEVAKQKLKRLKSMLELNTSGESKDLVQLVNWATEAKLIEEVKHYPVYDLLSLQSVMYQVTRSNNKNEDINDGCNKVQN